MSWGHGHSIVAGVIAGVAVAEHPFWLLAVAVVGGFAAGRVWAGVAGLTGAVRRRLDRA